MAESFAPRQGIRERWKDGVHYERVVPLGPTSVEAGNVEVIEFFSYGCAPCYLLEPHLAIWTQYRMPDYVEFVRVPAVYGPEPCANARLYYTLHALCRGDLDHEVFDSIFRLDQPLEIKDDPEGTCKRQLEFAQAHGIGAQEFTTAYHSPAVNSKVQRAKQLMRQYRVRTVPLMIINGKYKATPESAGGDAQLMDVVDELVAGEYCGRRETPAGATYSAST